MKKLGLFLAMALMFTGMYANAEWRPFRHHMNEPVTVTVRGIDFYIFPNGEFDFNAHVPRHRAYHHREHGVRVKRNRFGEIVRVGKVSINYNRHGQVVRIGNVFIKYNRRGLVARVGSRKLEYGVHGYVILNIGRHLTGEIVYNSTPVYDYYDGAPYKEVHYLKNKKIKTKGRR